MLVPKERHHHRRPHQAAILKKRKTKLKSRSSLMTRSPISMTESLRRVKNGPSMMRRSLKLSKRHLKPSQRGLQKSKRKDLRLTNLILILQNLFDRKVVQSYTNKSCRSSRNFRPRRLALLFDHRLTG